MLIRTKACKRACSSSTHEIVTTIVCIPYLGEALMKFS